MESTAHTEQDELQALRRRVEELENQLLDTEAWANRCVADAQDRLYWLERWHVDLNEVMRRRSATWTRKVLRALRRVYRIGLHAKRRWAGS